MKIKIPIFIELKSLNEFQGNIEDYITSKILNNKLSKNPRILKRLLESGKFLFLLDGYDEVYSGKKNTITHDVEDFMDRYIHNWYILTSRYGAGAESLPRFSITSINSLEGIEINDFVEQQCKLIIDKSLSQQIQNTINSSVNYKYESYLSNPLFLSMYMFSYRTHPLLPDQQSKFFYNIFDTLLTKHDSFSKKGGWQHEKKSKLDNSQIELILKWFSYISWAEEKYYFDQGYLERILESIKQELDINFITRDLIYDLMVNIGIILEDSGNLTYPHRSMQQYFTAYLIANLNDFDLKLKIYESSIKPFASELWYDSTLLELFNELDYFTFQEHVIIPILEDYSSKLKYSSTYEHFDKFISMYNDTIHLTVSNDKAKVSYHTTMPVGSDQCFMEFVLEGLDDSFVSIAIDRILNLEEVKEYFLNNYPPGNYNFEIPSHKIFLYPKLDETGFSDDISDYVKRIEEYISEFRSKTEKLKRNKIKLIRPIKN